METAYTEELPSYGDVMTVENFRNDCRAGYLIDYDGYGHPVKDNKMAKIRIYPSGRDLIPADATHILWFNR